VKFGIGLAPFGRWTSYDEMADAVAEPETGEFSVVSVDAEPPRLIIVEKFDDQDAYRAHEDNPEVLAVAGTLRGLLAGVDVTVGILDVS
jgi:quinol monooxygenase YgiN